MQTAALLAQAGRRQTPRRCRRTTALRMATINGARALGLAGEIGSLVAGQGGRRHLRRSGGRRASAVARSRVAAGLRCLTARRDRRLGRRRASRRRPSPVAARRRRDLRRGRALGRGSCARKEHDGERRLRASSRNSHPAPPNGGTRAARSARCTTSTRCASTTSRERVPLAGLRRARRRLRRRLAGRRPGGARRARRRDRHGAGEHRSRAAARRRRRLDDRLPLRRRRGSSRATQPGEFDAVTCLEMLEHVPEPGVDRRGLRRGVAARRHGVLLDDQPQPEELRARDRRRRVRARLAAARHARVREADPAGRARRVVPQGGPRRHGPHGAAPQPGDGRLLARRQRRRQLLRLRRARRAPAR